MSGNREKYVKRKVVDKIPIKIDVMGSRSDDTKYHRVFSKSRKSEKVKINRHWFWECFFPNATGCRFVLGFYLSFW